MKTCQNKHAQVLLLIPHYLSHEDFKFLRKTDADKFGSKKLKAKLKSMIWWIRLKVTKYFTVCNIEDSWMWFGSDSIFTFPTLSEVYQAIINSHAFPVVLWYQTVDQKVFENDTDVLGVWIDYYNKCLSESEIDSSSRGFI